LLRESRSWQNISKVSGEILRNRRILLISRNTSSLVIDSLCDHAGEENIAVAAFYCDFLSQQDQTINSIVGAILKQLVGRAGIAKDVRDAFQKAKNEIGGRGPRLSDLMGMLRTAIGSLHRVFICIDALDECLPNRLAELFESLRDIVRESPSARVFLTGRPHVGDDVRRYFAKTIVIPISPNIDDIRNYVEKRLDRDAEPEAMSNNLRADIVKTIQENISDMCVGPFHIFTLSMMYTYQRLWVDSSLCRSTWTLFWEK